MKRHTPDPLSAPESPSTLTVRHAAASDAAAWDGFAVACAEATFFHRFGWKRIIERVFRHATHYLLAERAGRIVAILPLSEVRSWLFGHTLVSLPFCVYGGVASMEGEAACALHDAAADLAVKLGVGYLELRNLSARQPSWARQDLYVTFRKELLPRVEANMLAIPRKQRAMVRKGISAGLRSEVNSSADQFFALYADNMHRHGTPSLPRNYFEALMQEFGDDCEILTVVSSQGLALSSVLSFYFRQEVLPYYAGDREIAREYAANDFKYWELMRRGCERGLKLFDYGRSKRGTGSFDFKKNWGFEPTQLHYEYRLVKRDTVPQNNPLNPRYRALIGAWRRLPKRVANTLGPYLARNLG